jgi:WD40 repeat protein
MKPSLLFIAAVLANCVVFISPARSQLLPSQAKGAARAQVVMLNIEGTVAAGVVAGYDNDKVYVATAAHVADLTSVPLPNVDVRFEDAPDISYQGVFYAKFDPPDKGDIAVVIVNSDDSLRTRLNGLDFAILSPVPLPPTGSPVTSVGYSYGSMWTNGTNESLLPNERGNLHFTSEVGEGQSGGAVYNDAWELIGMAVRSGAGAVYARPIDAVIKSLKSWDIPVRLTSRSLIGRVKGADELARENERRAQRALRRNLAQRLATQSNESREGSPVRSLLLGVEAVNATRQDGIAIAAAREALARSFRGASGSGLSGHTDSILKATFSADDALLATMSRDGAIRIWSLAEPDAPKCVKVLKESGQGDYIVSAFIAFDKNSKNLISQAFGTEGHLTSPKVWPLDTVGVYSDPKWLVPDHIPATALAVSQSLDLIAVADIKNGLSLYPLEGPLDRPTRVLSIPTGYVISHMAFSRDGTVLIAGTRDARVIIWDLSSAEDRPVTAFDTGHKERGPLSDSRPDLDLLDISKDRSLLLTGSSHWSMEGSFADPTLRIWPLQHLVPKRAPWIIDQSGAEPSKVVIDAFFDQTSRFVIGVTWSGTTNIWDLAKAHFDAKLETGTQFAQAKAVTFAESDTRSSGHDLLVLSQGKSVSVANIADMTSRRPSSARKLSGFDSPVQFVQLSSSARFLVAGGLGGAARLWDLTHIDPTAPSSSLVPNPYSEVQAIQLSSTGRTAIVLRGSALEFWNIERPSEPKHRFTTDIDVKGFGDCIVCHIVISPDEHWISLQSPAKEQSRIIEIGADGPARREFTVAARTWRNTGEILFSPDSRWLFVEETQNVRVVYDLQSTSIQRQVLSESGSYSVPTFSPDGKWVCFRRYVNEYHDPIGRDEIVGFIAPTDAITDGKKRVLLRGFATGIGSVEFSPDGRWVALSGDQSFPVREKDDRYVQVMHLEDAGWTKRADLIPIEYAAKALHFSADGRWMFTGSDDITVGDRNVSARVWDLSSPLTPTSGQVLPNVIWNLKCVEFSPDSKWLVTVSGAERYARLWALNEGKLRFISKLTGPQPHLNNHWFAVFSPDSSSVVLWTTDDATPFYWKLSDNLVNELGSAIPNGDREIQDVHFSASGRVLTILNSGGTTTGTSGSEGAHFTFVDLTAFPEEDSYAAIPASKGAYSHIYREDLGLILAAGESIVVIPTDLQNQLQRAANIAGRNLSWDEWVKVGISIRYRPTFSNIWVSADVIAAENGNFSDLAADQRATDAEQIRHNLVLWAQQLNDAESCNDVAWELAKQGDVLDALELSSRALRLAPSDPNYHDTRGLALALSGRREEAIAEFNYFIENAQGIERFARSIALRRKWIESLRSGEDPFATGIQ